jgi:hypothetical protein
VATNLRVHVDGVRLDRLQPTDAHDLFAGQELTLFARYHVGRRTATVTVEGGSADGAVRWTTTADFPGRAEENGFIARLWAVQRVGWLSAERRRVGATTELDDELRALGTRFGIPTELTSYLVVEPGMQVNVPVASTSRRDMSRPSSWLGGVGATAAPPPARAFEAAKAAADQRAVRTMTQLDAAQSATGAQQQFASGRMFTLQGEEWQDAPTGAPVPAALPRVIRVKAFSDAYFAILARLPVLQEAFALGERVSVSGRLVVIVLDPAGAVTLDASTLNVIVRDW